MAGQVAGPFTAPLAVGVGAAGRVGARVARGMAVLDRELPGWEWRVNLERLEMGCGVYTPHRYHSCACVLAQLNALPDRVGDYFHQRDALLDEGELDPAAWSEDHGFNVSGSTKALTQAWRYAIATRRATRMTDPHADRDPLATIREGAPR